MTQNPISPQSLYDIKEMFRSAEVYGMGAQTINVQMRAGPSPHLILPYILCAALSLEISLKCLIMVEGRSYKGIHELSKLFEAISEESQAKVKSLYEPFVAHHQMIFDHIHGQSEGAPIATFDRILRASSRAFTNLRYPYEKLTKGGEGWLATEITDCVRQVILDLKPEWKNEQYGFTQLGTGPVPA